MTYAEISKILPHRYPFILVDRVEEILVHPPRYPNRTGKKIRAIKNVTINEPFFPGHFPHRPVMPGVLIVESIAQTAALCCFRPEDGKKDVAIAGIKEAKFRKPVVPGDQLEIHLEVLKDRESMILFKGEVFVDKQLAAEAEILAYVFDMPKGEAN
ncbi:MAG: 3-hydroxyacyl-ACP dehydratase FabZ [Pseudobdellovibrionaceae bacterium]